MGRNTSARPPITKDSRHNTSRWVCYFYLFALLVYYGLSVPMLVIDFYVGKPYSWWEWFNLVAVILYTPMITLWFYQYTYQIFKWTAIYEVLKIRTRFGSTYTNAVPKIVDQDNPLDPYYPWYR